MKMFDGIHKYTVNTVFGIFQIIKDEKLEQPYNITIKQITETLIKPKINIKNTLEFDGRVFQSRVRAYMFLSNLEKKAIQDINNIMNEVVK